MHGVEMPVEEAEKLTDSRSKDWSSERAKGMLAPRAELDNRPKFGGYCGPMWDGTRPGGVAVLRYESPKVYAELSR